MRSTTQPSILPSLRTPSQVKNSMSQLWILTVLTWWQKPIKHNQHWIARFFEESQNWSDSHWFGNAWTHATYSSIKTGDDSRYYRGVSPSFGRRWGESTYSFGKCPSLFWKFRASVSWFSNIRTRFIVKHLFAMLKEDPDSKGKISLSVGLSMVTLS